MTRRFAHMARHARLRLSGSNLVVRAERNTRMSSPQSLLVSLILMAVLSAGFARQGHAQILLDAPQGAGGYYGLYSPDGLAASFTLSETSYVSMIDVVLRTPAATNFQDFAFSLQNALTGNIVTFASSVLRAPVGAVSRHSVDVDLTLPPGTYYLVGRVPGYFGTPVTPGNVNGWLLSTGVYSHSAGTITHGVWSVADNSLQTTSPAPAFTVHGPVTGAQPPTNLYVASVVGNTVTIRWTPPVVGPAPTSYVLEGGVGSGAVHASIVMDPVPVYTFQVPDGAFFIRVHSIAGAQRSAPSNEVPLFVNVSSLPSAPANLLGLVNGSTLGLAWRNTFGGGAPQSLMLDVTGALTTSIPLGLTDSFAFNGVPPGTYTLSLRAVNSAGVSTSSNPVTLTFPGPCSGPPLPPAPLVAYRVGNTIHVMWDPAPIGPAPTAFVLNVAGALAVSIPTPMRALSGGVGPGSYSLSVVALNPCGSSAPTPAQVVVVP